MSSGPKVWRPQDQEKPLVLSVCCHGVTDSFATMAKLRELERSNVFELMARGVNPNGNPQETPEGIRGLELQVDDIKRAVLLLIHSSNAYIFKQRFGEGLLSTLETSGILVVRDGRETQHLLKNTDTKRHIAEWNRIFTDMLNAALHRRPAEEVIAPGVFTAAVNADAVWQLRKQKGLERKEIRANGNGKHGKKPSFKRRAHNH